MFRTTARAALQPLRSQQTQTRRSFVSTVLLSKTYDDKTVAELRTELRARGLSASGAKATLITRIQQADAARITTEAPSSPAPASSPSQTRSASTSAPSASPTEAAPSSSAIPHSNAPPMTFDIKIPVYQAPPEPPVQVPFLPDFWDSSAVKKAEAAAASPTSDSSIPKIMLAAGAETHPAGGPTFALSPVAESLPSFDPSPAPASGPKKYKGVLGDVFDDLGIPHDVFAAKTTTAEPHELGAKRVVSTRPLDAEERRGAYSLLGLLFGAWVVAGIAAPSNGKSEKKKASKEKH